MTAPRLHRLWHNAYLLLTLTMLFWAGNSIVGRGVRDLVPPGALVFWRWLLGFLIVLPFAWPYLKRDRAVLAAKWPIMLLLGLLGGAAFNTLLYSGLQYTEALNSLLIQSAQPPFILLATFLLFRERAGLARIAGMLLSVVGVLAVLSRGDLHLLLGLRFNPGDTLILLAVLLWVLYSVLLRFRPAVHPLSFLAATAAIGWIAVLPLYLVELAGGRHIVPVPASFAALAYVAIFPSLIAYAFYNRGIELIGPGRAGIFLNLMPVFGALLAVGFLGETLTLAHGLGIALIGLGILLTRNR